MVNSEGDPTRIVSLVNGKLKIIPVTDNITHSAKNLPVAFVAVIGPSRTRKQFYTDLLINYFDSGCAWNFLTKLYNRERKDNPKQKRFQLDDSAPSGIYIWPKPFELQNFQGKYLIWILHMHIQKPMNEYEEMYTVEYQLLNNFLHLTCSRIITLVPNPDEGQVTDDLFYFKHKNTIDEEQFHLLKTIMCIYTTTSTQFKIITSEDHALTTGQLLHVKAGSDSQVSWVKLYDSVSIACVNNKVETHFDMSDTLNETIHKQLDQIIKVMGDYNHIYPGKFQNITWVLHNLAEYFKRCVLYTNKFSHNGALHISGNIKNGIEPQTSTTNEMLIRKIGIPTDMNRVSNSSEVVSKSEQEYLQNFISDKYRASLEANLDTPQSLFINDLLSRSKKDAYESYKKAKNMRAAERNKLRKRINAYYDSKKLYYSKVHHNILAFHHQASNHFKGYNYSNNEAMIHQDLIRIEINLFGKQITEELDPFIFQAFKHLRESYLKQIRSIIRFENSIVGNIHQSILESYSNQMNVITAETNYSPKIFLDFHLHLSRRYARAFEFCCVESPNVASDFEEPHSELKSEGLKNQLHNCFKAYQVKNRMKLAKKQSDINKLIAKQKKVYCTKMEEIIGANVDMQTLSTSHVKLLHACQSTLETNIRLVVGNLENTSKFVAVVLNKHIEKYWQNYQEAFKQKAGKNYAKHPQIRQEDNRDGQSRIQPTVIIHISYDNIRAAIPQGRTIKHIVSLPASVGLTQSGDWLCGNDVDSLSSERNTSIRVWKLRDYLSIDKKLASEKYNLKIADTNQTISVEFILGFLFYSTKRQLENELNGQIKDTIFIVPFWFTSSHRDQVIDAGKVAGFLKIKLVNENSAVAQFAAERLNTKDIIPDIVVLSENSNLIDISIYSIDSTNNAIKMVGNSEVFEIKNHFVTQMAKQIEEATIRALKQNQARPSVFGSLRKSVKNKNIKPREMFFCFASSAQEEIICAGKNNILERLDCNLGDCDSNMAIMGAIISGDEILSNEKPVQEWINSNIYCRAKSKVYDCFKKQTNGYMPAYGKDIEVSIPLPKKARELRFYQNLYNEKIEIGVLQLSRNEKHKQIELCINHHGIMTLKNTSGILHRNPSKLNDSQIFECSKALQHIEMKRQSVLEMTKQREEVLENLKSLYSRLKSGHGKFHSDVGREMAQRQICDAIEKLKRPLNSVYLQTVVDSYETIKTKYFLS